MGRALIHPVSWSRYTEFGTLPWTSRLRGWRGSQSARSPGLNQRGASMQKKLLMMAVAGALAAPGLALAQSSVEVYGTINISFGNWRFSQNPTGTQASMNKWDVAQSAS